MHRLLRRVALKRYLRRIFGMGVAQSIALAHLALAMASYRGCEAADSAATQSIGDHP